jgi:hypothetical protein
MPPAPTARTFARLICGRSQQEASDGAAAQLLSIYGDSSYFLTFSWSSGVSSTSGHCSCCCSAAAGAAMVAGCMRIMLCTNKAIDVTYWCCVEPCIRPFSFLTYCTPRPPPVAPDSPASRASPSLPLPSSSPATSPTIEGKIHYIRQQQFV